MRLFNRKKEKTEEVETLLRRESIPFYELEEKGYSLRMLGYRPSTGEVMVNVNREGLEDEIVAVGHTYISKGSGITISNVHGTQECTGELSDIKLSYRTNNLQCTHGQVERVIPLKRFLDEEHIQYRNDPPLEGLVAKLNKETERLMTQLREEKN